MTDKPIIFIVEDDTDILELLDLILKKSCTTYLFDAADENFFQLLNKIKPDIIILDWVTPLNNSEEVIKETRLKYSNATKILVISSYHKVKDVALDQGVDDYLLKPFHIKQLKQKISSLTLLKAPL